MSSSSPFIQSQSDSSQRSDGMQADASDMERAIDEAHLATTDQIFLLANNSGLL
jgi:hypothetical protein